MRINPFNNYNQQAPLNVQNGTTGAKDNALNKNGNNPFNQNPKDSVSFTGKGKEGLFTRFLNQAFGLDELIAKGTAKLSQTKFSNALVQTGRKFKNPTARWSDLESIAITYFYVQNTAKSKTLDDDRKLPSIIQNIAVTVVSSTAAALIDKSFDPLIDVLTLAYAKLPPETVKQLGGKTPKQFYDAARKLKSNTVFTAVVRFIIPVMMVPVVGSIVKKLKEKSNPEGDSKSQNQEAKPQAPQPEFKQNAIQNQTNNVPSLTNLSQINSAKQNNLANTLVAAVSNPQNLQNPQTAAPENIFANPKNAALNTTQANHIGQNQNENKFAVLFAQA